MSCRHSVGDTKVPFCLQSCVKPLEYAIAVHDVGSERTHHFVGKEPSGFRFNKLSLNEEGKCLVSSRPARSPHFMGKKLFFLKKLLIPFYHLTFVTTCYYILPSEPNRIALCVSLLSVPFMKYPLYSQQFIALVVRGQMSDNMLLFLVQINHITQW